MAMLDRIQGIFRKPEAAEADMSSVSEQDLARMATEGLAASSENPDFAESRMSVMEQPEVETMEVGILSLPVLGRRSAEQHRRTLTALLVVALIVLAGVVFYVLNKTERLGQQVAASGQALMQSQRLAKSVSQALIGNPAAFAEVKDSVDVLARSVRGFKDGEPTMGLAPLGAAFDTQLGELVPKVEDAERNAGVVLSQQKILTQVG
ncbi:MAG: type IV pili methyl-accepting chemotaxis transducer N-terminal domain-containing protein, partial [Hydrogenophaga sp.]|nr:type IV pili methyl-accepting chemotaxis transducer N-terminal domain-containing protein [Hydrogenophaga sp.]